MISRRYAVSVWLTSGVVKAGGLRCFVLHAAGDRRAIVDEVVAVVVRVLVAGVELDEVRRQTEQVTGGADLGIDPRPNAIVFAEREGLDVFRRT